MLSRKCAEWITGPELTPELAATIVDGGLQGSDVWDDVRTFAGGWKCVSLEEWHSDTDTNAAWLPYGCHIFDPHGECCLIAPTNGK